MKQDALSVRKGARERAPAKGAEVSDNPTSFADTTLGCGDMDTSETSTGKRDRAPAEGVVASDVPTQSASKRSRLGDLHLASVIDEEVAKERAQQWRSDMEEKIDTETREGPGASFVVDSGGPVLSARVAKERNRILRGNWRRRKSARTRTSREFREKGN